MFTSYFFYTGCWSSLPSMNCSVNIQSPSFLQENNTICKNLKILTFPEIRQQQRQHRHILPPPDGWMDGWIDEETSRQMEG